MKPRCSDCRFYEPSNKETGQCRRNPPVAYYNVFGSWWPEVYAGSWCGEFKKVEEENEK